MATATGIWILNDIPNYEPPVPPTPFPLPPVGPTERKPVGSKPTKSKAQRKHHYVFDVDDNGLDINGFVVQTAKPSHPRQKFRVFLDSNENGRFDKKDQLIGRSGLKQKHAAKGVGNLLDEGEIGQLEVKFKTTKSNASMRSYENDSSYDGTMIHRSVMSFADSDNINIVPPTPINPIIIVPPTLL